MPLDQWAECDVDDPDYDGVTPCLPPGLILDASPNSSSTILHGAPTTAGTYTFSISLNDGLNQAGVATYTLVVTSSAPPTLTSAAPSSGSTAGATSVTLTGTNFTGATAVTFGGTAATGFTVNNATTITATTPAQVLRAVYTDMDDVDFRHGVRVLTDAGFAVDYLNSTDPATITAAAHDATALLVGYATVTAEMMDAMPALRIIALLSMGFNNIDVDAARERGIWVTNIPGAATEEVASHALALALAVVRNLPFYSNAVQTGDWNARDTLVPPRLSQARLGILGLGRSGQDCQGHYGGRL